jgi:PAS domain S-box-containing protein
MRLQTVFADGSFQNFLSSNINASRAAMVIQSNINNHKITWEISAYGRNNFICTGALSALKEVKAQTCQNPFSVFFDNSPALMWATDKNGVIQMMNKRYKEHTGFTDEQLGKSLWDVYPKEMADQFKKNDDIVLETNVLCEIEEISVDKAGNRRNYIAYKFPLETAENGTLVAGCSIDITDALEKTRQLHFQSHLLDRIEQAVYILDGYTKFIYWSNYAEKMFGWTREEILQKEFCVLQTEGSECAEMIAKLQTVKSWHGEIELKRKDGTAIQVHSTKSPVHDAENNVIAFIGISKDMSEHKTVHKKLVKQNNQFRQIARLQSHAVRRPLANMLGLIDLIQYYADKQEHQEMLYMINLLKQSSEELDDIIKRIVLKAGVYFDPELQIA